MKGKVLEKLGRCEEALESYREALKLKPEYKEAKKALKNWKKAIEQPNNHTKNRRQQTPQKPTKNIL
jgi:tetratricopeptide (TPR) repeat protein